MAALPKDKNKPFTINGIKFVNRDEYDKRVNEDARKMAEFLYDMYQRKSVKINTSHNKYSASDPNRGQCYLLAT